MNKISKDTKDGKWYEVVGGIFYLMILIFGTIYIVYRLFQIFR